VLIDFAGRASSRSAIQRRPFRFRQVHEIGADRATVDAACFLGGFAGERIQVRLLQWFEQASGSSVASIAQRRNASKMRSRASSLAAFGNRPRVSWAPSAFLRGALLPECSVCHKSSSMNLLFCHRANGLLPACGKVC